MNQLDRVSTYRELLYRALDVLEQHEPDYFYEHPELEQSAIEAIDSSKLHKLMFQLNQLNKTIDSLS